MIFVTDAVGACVYTSSEWTTLTGQEVADALGLGWLDRVYSDDRAIVAETMAAAVRRGEEFSVRYRLLKPDRTLRWVGAGGVPAFGMLGHNFIGYFGTVTELAAGATDTITAYGKIERFVPPAPHPNTMLNCRLDQVADHLLPAHSLIESDGGKEALPDLRSALFKIGRALAARIEVKERLN
ncbi:PAS domain-containing protein [Methylobacterium sp. E-005]|uniref:PAS domain-containing protein n=1 Tax=Methylobacterium sp. E-005 TaxID=2836549 RepID=UPI001FBBFAFE|nr:PAS domain-containing protein [Methylobacterium sp. E-005]MCJ2088031.1 PAS domain-containing protein [Methylobacterium sp. E-005]